MYPSVKAIAPQDNCLLYITFNNGEAGTLDMKPYLDFGIFLSSFPRSTWER